MTYQLILCVCVTAIGVCHAAGYGGSSSSGGYGGSGGASSSSGGYGGSSSGGYESGAMKMSMSIGKAGSMGMNSYGSNGGYGGMGSKGSMGMMGMGYGGDSDMAVDLARNTMHNIKYVDVPSTGMVMPTSIEIGAQAIPINFVFRSASSQLNVQQKHESAQGSTQESNSVDDAHVLKHTVKKPIYQEVHEVITPKRNIFQEIKPVEEEIETIISRDDRMSGGAGAGMGGYGGSGSMGSSYGGSMGGSMSAGESYGSSMGGSKSSSMMSTYGGGSMSGMSSTAGSGYGSMSAKGGAGYSSGFGKASKGMMSRTGTKY